FTRAIYGAVNSIARGATFGLAGAPNFAHKLEQAITSQLGRWAEGWRDRIGQYFHDLSGVLDRLGNSILDNAAIMFGLVALVVKYDLDAAAIRAAARLTRKTIHAITASSTQTA